MISFLPDDLSGQSVLVVGCGLGEMCAEASQRGASDVLGIDIDKDVLPHAAASRVTDVARFAWADAEVELPEGRFDHVIVHNLLHRVRNPISLLDRLGDSATKTITLEVTGMNDERPRRLLRRDYGALDEFPTRLEELPLALVGRNGTPNRKRESKFYFSPLALRHLLMEHRRHFATWTCEPAATPGRWLCHVERRRVGHLVVVSGPTGTGKSTMIEQLTEGEETSKFVATAAAMTVGESYKVANGDRVPTLEVYEPRVLFHYDLLRPWRRDARVHARDEALHLLDGAERIHVVSLVARPSVLKERLDREIDQLVDHSGRTAIRLRDVRALYDDPSRLAEHYSDWLAFCASKGAQISFVDTTNGYQPLDEHSWQQIVQDG